MEILITGGSGFIGSHFHKNISQEKIINLDLHEPSFEYESKFFKGDIRNITDVDNAMSGGVDTVISLAAMHHDFGISEDEYFETNEKGTQVLCEAAGKKGIKTIVFYSSVAVYGANEEMSHEEMAPNPNMPYGASKLAGEKVLYKWAEEDPSRKVLIIRPALVFGINNTANMYKLINQINLGIYFHVGKANNIKSIGYVENLVKATLWLLEDLPKGVSIFNYADEPHLTSKKIATTISEALGKKIRITVPKTLGIMMGLPFDLIIKATGKNLPISSARVKKLATETAHSASKLFEKGFKPEFSTQEGLRKMVKWYLETKMN
ncbi:NAD-dependent epimerase/dehydratase family protein [Fulvivirga sediminis]|uniref:NAD-dependent epimerase/dehydratase family protein n=1 Tax=Fulvivirga sediminis TaxID=2803949 RepID=A0A937F5T3_9BACT|nr:NAD-dependent epimerase/dehydratase family protein [Fulvivirga sediminis]MBL3654840.1 NAD-dependent epimerase/dehydratase family protein [Fulvivirga sediminis]